MKRLTTKEFVDKARKIHRNKYDYSLVQYKNNYTKVKIICENHGVFEQCPYNHVNNNQNGCPECAQEQRKKKNIKSLPLFIKQAKQIHKNRYDYSKVVYENWCTKIEIVCFVHGSFWQLPTNHISNKNGCPQCSNKQKTKKLEKFIVDAKRIHNNKYDYSKVQYKNIRTKVEILCKKHGSFWQLPTNHTDNKQGCPICKLSKGEEQIRNTLDELKEIYTRQRTFKKCCDKTFLPFDFFLPQYNMCIEYDGQQHFCPTKYSSKTTNKQALVNYKDVKHRDKIKTKYCKDNNIYLLRIKYTRFKNISKILKNEINNQKQHKLKSSCC